VRFSCALPAATNGLDGSGKKEVLQLHLQLQLVLEFSMKRQGEALPETLITLYYDTPGHVDLL
jgi:hypothetical protein